MSFIAGLTVETTIAVLTFLYGQAKNFWVWARQNHGDDIPSWEQLDADYERLKDKIEKS